MWNWSFYVWYEYLWPERYISLIEKVLKHILNSLIMKIVDIVFPPALSWIKTTWFTWRPTTSCWSRGWRSSRTRSIFLAAASSSRQSRSSTHTSSVTWLLLTAPGTWWDYYCVSLLINDKHSSYILLMPDRGYLSSFYFAALAYNVNRSIYFSLCHS